MKNLEGKIAIVTGAARGIGQQIAKVLAEGNGKAVRSKRVSVIDCIPVANKKVASADDVDKVVNAIRTKLLAELKENDELNLD